MRTQHFSNKVNQPRKIYILTPGILPFLNTGIKL